MNTCTDSKSSERASAKAAFSALRPPKFNLVERWFAEITRKRIRRGSLKSVKDLIDTINNYIAHNNQNPKPFIWTKRVDQILEKVAYCKANAVTLH